MNKENKILIRTTDSNGRVLNEKWIKIEPKSLLVQYIPHDEYGDLTIDAVEVAELINNLMEIIRNKELDVKVFTTKLKTKKLRVSENQIIIQEIPIVKGKSIIDDCLGNQFSELLENYLQKTKDEMVVVATPFKIKVINID